MVTVGGYEGVLNIMDPQQDIAIDVVAAQTGLDWRPYDGSAAEFIKTQLD